MTNFPLCAVPGCPCAATFEPGVCGFHLGDGQLTLNLEEVPS